MEFTTVTHQNWLTLPPKHERRNTALFLVLLLAISTFAFVSGFGGAEGWMAASKHQVFVKHEYWRAWTALFAHADGAHLLSNLILFFPFAFLLMSYFSLTFFPFFAFFAGGLANFLVLSTMPENTSLVGASGVVYWMGGAWITLSFLIDRRESVGRRLLKSLGVSILLFIPETYRPEVSYFAHFVGYVSGVLSSVLYYHFRKSEFLAAEVVNRVIEIDPFWEEGEWENPPRLNAQVFEGPQRNPCTELTSAHRCRASAEACS